MSKAFIYTFAWVCISACVGLKLLQLGGEQFVCVALDVLSINYPTNQPSTIPTKNTNLATLTGERPKKPTNQPTNPPTTLSID